MIMKADDTISVWQSMALAVLLWPFFLIWNSNSEFKILLSPSRGLPPPRPTCPRPTGRQGVIVAQTASQRLMAWPSDSPQAQHSIFLQWFSHFLNLRVQAADTFMCHIMYIYLILTWYFIKVSSAKKLWVNPETKTHMGLEHSGVSNTTGAGEILVRPQHKKN